MRKASIGFEMPLDELHQVAGRRQVQESKRQKTLLHNVILNVLKTANALKTRVNIMLAAIKRTKRKKV